jgi:RsiW-degrading membrane proteinase PrsW (M82 family)
VTATAFLLHFALGTLPALGYLLALRVIDSYKLVHLPVMLLALLGGGVAAAISYAGNVAAIELLQIPFETLSRFVAPWVEEIAKALLLVWWIRRGRIGLLVDAAIIGFAIGAGFALVESLYYLITRPELGTPVWFVRGFGAAVMHGGATATLGIVAIGLGERYARAGLLVFLPGLLVAVALHTLWNQLLAQPTVALLVMLLLVPTLLGVSFWQSERGLEGWLHENFDADVEMLELLGSGSFLDSRPGQYLKTLRERFDGPVVADMLCYLRLHTELAIRAKGELLLREAGMEMPIDDPTRDKLAELKSLEQSVGRAGQLALEPILLMRRKDLWQFYLLGQ